MSVYRISGMLGGPSLSAPLVLRFRTKNIYCPLPRQNWNQPHIMLMRKKKRLPLN